MLPDHFFTAGLGNCQRSIVNFEQNLITVDHADQAELVVDDPAEVSFTIAKVEFSQLTISHVVSKTRKLLR